MPDKEMKTLEEKIAALKSRIPPHSIPPAMLEELEELEEQLQQLKNPES